jgi:hypothetical protein
MATQEQMRMTVKSITTMHGDTYELVRPTIGFWYEFNQFQDVIAQQDMTSAITNEFLDAYIEFLGKWLRRRYPDITPDEIREAFDPSDIPELMRIITEFMGEVRAASPPASGVGSRTPRLRKQ